MIAIAIVAFACSLINTDVARLVSLISALLEALIVRIQALSIGQSSRIGRMNCGNVDIVRDI